MWIAVLVYPDGHKFATDSDGIKKFKSQREARIFCFTNHPGIEAIFYKKVYDTERRRPWKA